MKLIILQFIVPYFLTLLMLPEMSCDSQKIFCHKNEIQECQKQFFPIIWKNKENNDYVFKENLQLLELIISFDEELLEGDDQMLVFSNIQDYRLIQIYQREKLYLLQMKELKLSIFNSKEYNVQMEIIYSFNFNIENCDKITNAYYLIQQKFIIVCEQVENYQINIIKINQSATEIVQSFDFQKQIECQFDVLFNEINQQFLSIFLNCLDWDIQMIDFQEHDTPHFIVMANKANFVQELILRKIIFVDNQYFFQFDHQIIQHIIGSNMINYLNFENRILDFEIKSFGQIIVLQSNNEQKSSIQRMDINKIVITQYLKPKKILMFYNSIVLLSESHLECIAREDETFIFQVQLESIQTISFQPFFIGKRNNQFILFKKNDYSPLYNCNDYLNQTHIYFASSNLFKQTEFLQQEITIDDFSTNRSFLANINMPIKEEEFTFQLKPDSFYDNYISSKMQFLENDAIYCEEQQYDVVQDCLNDPKFKYLWQFNSISNQQLIKIVQLQNNLQIILMQCNSGTNFSYGNFEEIKKENIFIFKNAMFLLQTQKRKVFKINLKRPYLKNIFEFKEEVIHIVQQTRGYQFVLKSCVSYLLQKDYQAIQQYNYKVNSDGQCIQEKLFYYDFLEVDLSNKVFNFKSEHFIIELQFYNYTNTFSFQNQTVHYFNQQYKGNNSFVMIQTIGDGIIATSYLYVNFQLIPITLVQNEKLNYAYPLKFRVNTFYLVIAAFDQENNSVLFIYSLQQFYKNNLIDIIKVDNFTFFLTDFNEIFFYQQQQLKKSTFLHTSVKCRINEFAEPIKNIKVPLLLFYKFDQTQSQLNYIQLNLTNRFQQLKSTSTKVLQLKYHSLQQFILFDPRRFAFGPIETIITNTYELIFPIIQVDYINRLKCENVDQAICVNENNQSITISNIYGSSQYFKTFDLQQKSHFMTLNSGLYFIVYYQQEIYYFIELYLKSKLENIANFRLIKQYQNLILSIQIINQYCLISFEHSISFYEIRNNTFIKINSLDCHFCQVNQINNSNFVAIYQKLALNKTIEIIIYDFFNQQHFQVNATLNEFINTPENFQSYFQVLFMEQIDNKINSLFYNQYYAQVFIMLSESYNQVVELSFNKENLTILRSALMRVFQNTINQEIFFMQNNQVLILSCYNILKRQNTISIYNLSEVNLIDELYTLYTNFQLVLKYNESHFIVVPNDKSQDYIVYQVDSYKIKIDHQQTKSFNLTVKNSLSQLEFQIDLKNEKEENIFEIQLSIIIVCEVILFSFLLKKRRSKTMQQ